MVSREACREWRRSIDEDSDRTSVERRDPSLFSRRLRSDSEIDGRLGRDSTDSLPVVPITGILLKGAKKKKKVGYGQHTLIVEDMEAEN